MGHEARTARESGVAASNLAFGFPQFEIPKVEIPPALREVAIQAMDQARMNYEKLKPAAVQMSRLAELTCSAANNSAARYRDTVLGAMRVNTNSAFDFAIDLAFAGSLAEMAELSAAYARRQSELFFAHSKEFWAFAYQLAPESAEPSTNVGSTLIRSMP